MRLPFHVALFVLLTALQIRATDPHELHDTVQEKPFSHQKRRLSLQSSADIQHCLVTSGEVGCGMFECFNNNSCEIRGLQDICFTFLHNAGKFDAQGKSFIKDALRCLATGLRQRFSCVSRRCQTLEDMVYQLQRECYAKHNVCLVVNDNLGVMADMIHFHLLFPKGPHVELVNILLGCGEAVRAAITRHVMAQCEQNWGVLCASLSLCSLGQSASSQPFTAPPPSRQAGNTVASLREARTALPRNASLAPESSPSPVPLDGSGISATQVEPTTAT